MGKFVRDLGWVLGLALVCGLMGGIVTALWPIELSPATSVSVKKISLNEFVSLAEKVIILDARAQGFYELGHVPGARNLSREKFEEDLARVMKQAPDLAQREIVVYCSGVDCEDSAIVAEKLWQHGITNIVIFEGGWEEWEAAGLEGEADE